MNLGAQAAKKALEKHGAKAQVARELDVRLDRVSRIVGGERLPNPKERAYFEDKYGIGWRLWDEVVEGEEPAPASEPKPNRGAKGAA